jgi:hypothetical protein
MVYHANGLEDLKLLLCQIPQNWFQGSKYSLIKLISFIANGKKWPPLRKDQVISKKKMKLS